MSVPAVEKPLNQTQLKNLSKIVEGDFADLLDKILIEIKDRRDRKIDEIQESYRSKGVDLEEGRQKLLDAARKAEDDLQAVINKLASSGISSGSGYQIFQVTVRTDHLAQRGLDDEIKKVTNAAVRLDRNARAILSRQERQVQRLVLLQGISSQGAMEIINDLPDKDEVMSMLVSELTDDHKDALRLLMSDKEIKALNEGD